MKLSKLTYLCVKNAVYYDDNSFTYETFLLGRYDNDPDYSTNIHNVFSPLNLAISRLNDMDKLPFSMLQLTDGRITVNNVNGIPVNCLPDGVEVNAVIQGCPANTCDITDIKDTIKEVIGLGAVDGRGTIRPLRFIYMYGSSRIKVESPLYVGDTIVLEYKKDIPFLSNSHDFSEEGYYYEYEEEYSQELEKMVPMEVADVELKDFGITDAMCNYIIEYVRAYLLEPIDPHLSNMHLNRAEQYFNNISYYDSAFAQQKIEKVYSIGD